MTINEAIEQARAALRSRKDFKSEQCREECVNHALAILEQAESKGEHDISEFYPQQEPAQAESSSGGFPTENRCDRCGTKFIDKCIHCGAPQCCPLCCAQARLNAQAERIERLKESYDQLHIDFDYLVTENANLTAENQAQAERIKKLEKLLERASNWFNEHCEHNQLGLYEEIEEALVPGASRRQPSPGGHPQAEPSAFPDTQQVRSILTDTIPNLYVSIIRQECAKIDRLTERIEKLIAERGHAQNGTHKALVEIDRLTAEKQAQFGEIEKLKNTLAYERRLDSSVRDQNARTYAENKRLTAVIKAQAERIEKLIGACKETKSQIEFSHKTETGYGHWTPIHNFIESVLSDVLKGKQ